MKVISLVFMLFLACIRLAVAGDSVNENEIFSNQEQFIQPVVSTNTTSQAEEQKSIGFSGEITYATVGIISSTSTTNPLYTYTVGNIFLDVRMKRGIKAFANLETTYLSQNKVTEVALRELFFDFNYEHRVYFRTGKQVLQWGRCYFWNPTDLINIEKKSFIKKIGYREGAYGTKIHIPYGTSMNIYGFWDTDNAPTPGDSGGALKFEFLTGRTEMAFSGWAKGSYNPVFGYDFSTRVKNVDVVGELSISHGENTNRIKEEQGTLSIFRRNDEWSPKMSVGLNKGYRLGNFKDRIMITGEMYYNHLGYTEDVFNDKAVYKFSAPIIKQDINGLPLIINSGTKKDFLTSNNLYDMNNYSQYYAAIFSSISRFIISDMTLNFNFIRNFCDGSGILSVGVTYANINDFSAGILLNSFLGNANREYTFSDQKFNYQLTFGINF